MPDPLHLLKVSAPPAWAPHAAPTVGTALWFRGEVIAVVYPPAAHPSDTTCAWYVFRTDGSLTVGRSGTAHCGDAARSAADSWVASCFTAAASDDPELQAAREGMLAAEERVRAAQAEYALECRAYEKRLGEIAEG